MDVEIIDNFVDEDEAQNLLSFLKLEVQRHNDSYNFEYRKIPLEFRYYVNKLNTSISKIKVELILPGISKVPIIEPANKAYLFLGSDTDIQIGTNKRWRAGRVAKNSLVTLGKETREKAGLGIPAQENIRLFLITFISGKKEKEIKPPISYEYLLGEETEEITSGNEKFKPSIRKRIPKKQ
jgi:hypothetical protein